MAERLTASIKRHGTVASVPEGVTLEDINSAKNNRMKEIAVKFSPPVSFAECRNIREKRERLRCAYRRATGEAKDIDAFGNLMGSLKQSDAAKRKELLDLCQKLTDDLAEFEAEDGFLEKHLNQQEGTKDFATKIRKIKTVLDNHECPIVVAGQTSAGKSTLLNLFLGEMILPSQLLSCTATICELAYAEKQAAEVVYEDGKKESIPFDHKEEYIYKKSERDEKYTHQSVTIKTPVTFLKSGVVLVDTPGVGENVSMSSVLLDYVKQSDVFGFIFVIKCDDSGGVLHRFREMLRELAVIKDSEGHHKLEPKSVIFIANFWDKVPNDEKDATKDLIIRTLSLERCLEGFDPEHQLFFINSNFAWHTWKIGLISEDFENVLNGIEKFFPIGHTRKLQWAYRWLEKVILQVMLRIDTFLAKAKITETALKSHTKEMTKELDLALQVIKDAQDAAGEKFVEARAQLHAAVREFLNSPEADQAITTWLPGQIPKKEFADEWILLEERLDQAINDRISAVLQDWEISKKKFENAENLLLKIVREKFDPIFSKLDYIEESMRNMSEIKPVQVGLHRNPSEDFHLEKREFDVSIATEIGGEYTQSLNEFLGSLFTSRSLLFKSEKKKQQKVQKSIADFEKDKVRFMATRSGQVLNQLCSGNKEASIFINKLVDEELQQMRENFETVVMEITDRAKSDKKLIEEIMEDKRENKRLDEVYSPIATAFRQLTEEALTFRYKYIEDFSFAEGSLKEKVTRISGSVTPNGCFGDVCNKEEMNTRRVIVKAFTNFVGRRHVFFMVKCLRSLAIYNKTEPTVVQFIGLLQGDVPSVVLDGWLSPARGYLCRTPASRKLYLQIVKTFVENLTRGIRFLHIRKLIHMEVSLDSILVNKDGIPKLSNISETIDVPFPDDKEKCGNFVYMAPETYRGSRYTDAADMYGLGLLLLEIWSHQDLYQDVKTTWPLNQLLAYPDPGPLLYKSIHRTTLDKYHPEFVERCLTKSAHERPSITEWGNQLGMWWNHLEKENQI